MKIVSFNPAFILDPTFFASYEIGYSPRYSDEK
jgi:hypothetical protein